MESTLPKKGVELTDQLYNQFQILLNSLGEGNLLGKSPALATTKLDETNAAVSTLLGNMKTTLSELRYAYDFCEKEMKLNGHKVPTLDEMIGKKHSTQDKMEVDRSPEFLQLQEQLRKKNGDLKQVIEELQSIWKLINQLAPT